jgi:hypothetical protein
MGWMMQGFIVAQAIECLFVQNVQTISGAQPACVQLSARGSSGEMRVGHDIDLPRLRMSGTVPLLLL